MLLPDKNDAQFAEVFRHYYPIIFSIIYKKIKALDLAEDLTQEVFIRYYKKSDQVVENSTKAWLCAVARNVLSEYFRRSEKDGDLSDISEMENSTELSYHNGFRDARLLIKEAIENIESEDDRTLFEMVAIQKYTYEEAGKLIGLSKRQVKYRYNLIIQSMQKFFRERGIQSMEDLL